MKFEIPNQKEETIFVEIEPKDYILPVKKFNIKSKKSAKLINEFLHEKCYK
jgi:hypothetical protein